MTGNRTALGIEQARCTPGGPRPLASHFHRIFRMFAARITILAWAELFKAIVILRMGKRDTTDRAHGLPYSVFRITWRIIYYVLCINDTSMLAKHRSLWFDYQTRMYVVPHALFNNCAFSIPAGETFR